MGWLKDTFKGYLPGGASGGILPASMGDLPLDFGKLEEHGCFVGSHAVVILSDQDHMGRGPQPYALLRGRELRPVHAVPGRQKNPSNLWKSINGMKVADGARHLHGGCFDLHSLGQAAANPYFQYSQFREDVT